MSASSSAGGSSFPPTRPPSQRPPIPRAASRPKHHPTCRCSQCYLRPTLFPRGDRGKILLPRPTWLESSGTGESSWEVPPSRPGSGSSNPSGKGKGREIVSPIPSWSHDVRRLEGRLEGSTHPKSPSWYQSEAVGERSYSSAQNIAIRPSTSSGTYTNPGSSRAPNSPRPEMSIAGPSSRPPRPSGNAATLTDRRATPRVPLHLSERREPVFLTPVLSSAPSTAPPSRTGNKRKLSDLYDTLDPTEHVLDFRNPPPPQGREPLRGFPRQRVKMRSDSAGLSSGYSRQGTPETHIQPYRSHVLQNASPRGQFATETAGMGGGPRSSRPRSVSEVGLWSTGAGPSRRPRGSPSSEGHQPHQSPPGEGSGSAGNSESQVSMSRFSARTRNPVPSVTTPRGSDDDEGHASGSQGGSSAPPSQSTIRFREPLTASSRQDRRVVKGGVATMQVKWDSDRKRRQGYFAPDAGSEKSKFRHYSKEDCCFDE